MHKIKLGIFLAFGISFPLFGWGLSIYVPQGQREALMANTGIALNASEGAAIYNPAGTAGLEAGRISAGGSLLNASVLKIDGNESNYVNDKNTSPSYSQIPGLVTGYQKFDWGRAGFFINTDYTVNFDKLIAFTSPVSTSYSEMLTSMNSLNLGLIYAQGIQLSNELRLQFGLTTSLQMIESQQSLFSKSYTNSSSTYTSAFSNQNVKTTNAVARLGTLLVTPNYSLGAYYQPKGSTVSTSFSKFSYQVSSTGSVQDDSANEGPAYFTSETYGLGASFNLTKTLRLYLDGNVVSPNRVDEEDRVNSGSRLETFGLGADYIMVSGNHVYAGLTQSTLKDDMTTKGWLFSSGFDYKISFIKNYFGAYYSSFNTPANPSTRSSATSLGWFGVFIASQYSY